MAIRFAILALRDGYKGFAAAIKSLCWLLPGFPFSFRMVSGGYCASVRCSFLFSTGVDHFLRALRKLATGI